MADKIKLEEGETWDDEDTYSERYYDEYRVQAGKYDRHSYDYSEPRVEMVNLTLYIDELTGTVVYDIAKYEESLK